jgi:glutamate-1-semialdehyde 2,1-aminomutase
MNAPYEFIVAPYNDIVGTDSLVAALPPDSLAAILVEPMQVSGGCIPGTVDFLRHLREVATAEKALLIFDEIMTSRLDYGGLQVPLGIKPDITTIGKWAGGGMSFGAFGARREIMEWFDPRREKLAHAGTFNNNIITMAAGVAGNDIMTEERLAELNALGSNLMAAIAKTIDAGLSPLLPNGCETQQPKKIFVTGRGSLFAIRFSGPESGILRELFYHHLLTHGIFIASRGFLALTLEITEAHCTRLLQVIEDFVAKYGPALL